MIPRHDSQIDDERSGKAQTGRIRDAESERVLDGGELLTNTAGCRWIIHRFIYSVNGSGNSIHR